MQVNHLAPALLSILLLPSLIRGSPSRIVNVNSIVSPMPWYASAYIYACMYIYKSFSVYYVSLAIFKYISILKFWLCGCWNLDNSHVPVSSRHMHFEKTVLPQWYIVVINVPNMVHICSTVVYFAIPEVFLLYLQYFLTRRHLNTLQTINQRSHISHRYF